MIDLVARVLFGFLLASVGYVVVDRTLARYLTGSWRGQPSDLPSQQRPSNEE